MLTSNTKRHIDAARQVLVGKVPDPKSQIEQITNALIYKFMDDMDEQSAALGGKRRYFVGDYEKYGWQRLMNEGLGAHERLILYREAIEGMAKNPNLPELFRSIFRNAYLPFNDARTLSLFLTEVNYFSYANSEELGNGYEYLLSIMGSQGDAGQFRTPRHIIDFIVAAVNPTKSDSVLDPACGTAGFLISAYKHVMAQHDGKDDISGVYEQNEIPLTADEKKKLYHSYHGFDIDDNMVKMAKVNMYLHSFPEPNIIVHDSLSSEDLWNERYDVILANPPFMSPKGGIVPHKKFGINANRAEVLFVDYIASHLKPNGRAGIIVPDGVLTRADSNNYANLRKQLVDNGLWAVVDLPRGVFEPYSKVKTSVLLIDKSFNTNEIAFLKLEPSSRQQNVEIDQNTQLNIVDSLKALHKYRQGVSIDGLEAIHKSDLRDSKNGVLAATHYANDTDTQVGYVALGDILEKVSRKVGLENLDTPVMSITMQNGLVDQSEKFKKRIATVDISKYKLVLRNELVVGFPIDEGVLGFQTKHDQAAVSPAYDVWRLRNKDLPVEYLEKILRSKQAVDIYRKNIKGTANRRRVVPKDIFLKIKIPIADETSNIYHELNKILTMQDSLKDQLVEAQVNLDRVINEAWNVGEEYTDVQ